MIAVNLCAWGRPEPHDNHSYHACTNWKIKEEEQKRLQEMKQKNADNRFRTFNSQSSIYNMGDSE